MGIEEILEAVVARIPPPKGNPAGPLRAMIVDSWFDTYVGVVMLVRVVDGRLAKGERIKMMATGTTYNADIGIEPTVNNHGTQRTRRVAFGRRNARHHGFENFLNPHAGFRRAGNRVGGINAC